MCTALRVPVESCAIESGRALWLYAESFSTLSVQTNGKVERFNHYL